MSSRMVHKMGLKEDPQNFLLMHAAGVNVGGQIAERYRGRPDPQPDRQV